ncbi:MAG: hypothetical protein AAGG51_13545 [Cyanobacteria bacterium P01_G01_bin.54]
MTDLEEAIRVVFGKRTNVFSARVRTRVEEIEKRFNIRGEVSIFKIPSNRIHYQFDDNLISHLRPQKHRIFLEEILPFEWLHRSIELPFEKAKVQILYAEIELKIDSSGNNIIKNVAQQKLEARERSENGAVDISNRHIKSASNSHVGGLLNDYEEAYKKYVEEWGNWLVKYQNLIDLAISVSRPDIQDTITKVVEDLRRHANDFRV